MTELEKAEEIEKENEELKETIELNSSIANSFQQKICILEKENAELNKLIKDYEISEKEVFLKGYEKAIDDIRDRYLALFNNKPTEDSVIYISTLEGITGILYMRRKEKYEEE